MTDPKSPPAHVWILIHGELAEGGTVCSVHETREWAEAAALNYAASSHEHDDWALVEDRPNCKTWQHGCEYLTIERFEVRP